MKATSRILLAAAISGGLALSAFGQQASITLRNGDVAFCNSQATTWSVKTLDTSPNGSDYQKASSDGTLLQWVSPSAPDAFVTPWTGGTHATVTTGDTINWTVTVDRTLGAKTITAVGFVAVQNTGSAPATIGNIVVNLQRQKTYNKKSYWVSAAADIANAVSMSNASSVNIVAAGSAEDPVVNAAVNAPPVPNPLLLPDLRNYTVSGSQGTFKKTAGSGTLEFTGADANTLFAMTPQPTIAVGQVVRLYYIATFNNDVLQIPDNTSLRTEVIVTFGNSGARGGGGATANSIDINGDGVIDNTTALQYQPVLPANTVPEAGANDADELNVRSVPNRITKNLPAMEICNEAMTLTTALLAVGPATRLTPSPDDDPLATEANPNSFTLDNFSYNGGPAGSVTVAGTGAGVFVPELDPLVESLPYGLEVVTLHASSLSFPVTRTFSGTLGAVDGAVGIAGAAILSGGVGDSVSLNVPTYNSSGQQIFDILTGLPVYEQFTVPCCPSFDDLLAVAWPTYTPPPPTTHKKYFSYTKGGYGKNAQNPGVGIPDLLFAANYGVTTFTTGLTIGVEAADPKHDATWTASAGSQLAQFLVSSASGPSGALTADTDNATSTTGGNLPRQTATLALNVGFSDAASPSAIPALIVSFSSDPVMAPGFGDLILHDYTPIPALNNKSIRQILGIANDLLGGNALPSAYGTDFGSFNTLITDLNESFDNGKEFGNATAFANAYLSQP